MLCIKAAEYFVLAILFRDLIRFCLDLNLLDNFPVLLFKYSVLIRILVDLE